MNNNTSRRVCSALVDGCCNGNLKKERNQWASDSVISDASAAHIREVYIYIITLEEKNEELRFSMNIGLERHQR